MMTKLWIAISATAIATNAAMAGVPPPPPFGMSILSAVVDSDATVARGAGVTGTVHFGPGEYEIDFNRDVSGCVYNATVGMIGAGSVQGLTDDEARFGNANGVYLETFDLTGNLTDKPFHLVVFCAK